MSGGGLAERLREAAVKDASEVDEETLAKARAEKSSLADRLADLQAEEIVDAVAVDSGSLAARMQAMQAGEADPGPQSLVMPPGPSPFDGGEPRKTVVPAAVEKKELPKAGEELGATERSKFVNWFLGREEQEKSGDDVTFIPPMPHGYEEVEFYEIEPPYSFVRIRREIATGELIYEAIEPRLSHDERQILDFVEDAIIRGLNVDPTGMGETERTEILEKAVGQIIRDYRIKLSDVSQTRVEYYLRRDFIGLGNIHILMKDPGIEDISCDGHQEPLFIFHRRYESIATTLRFPSDTVLDAFVTRLAQRSGKAISISDPILDAALPDGSRLQATLGQEVTQNGSTFTIRRFKPDPFTPIDLVRFGTMSKELLAYFWMIVENGSSLIFSGGTASGKTTGLNAISQFIPPAAKIVSIEDTREVNLPHHNWIKAVTRSGASQEGAGEIGMFALLKASLRQRPDYILVGEVRGIEASVAFQAMATGHTVYSTMHADSARSVVYRLENEPINIPRLVLQALDVIAIQAQVRYQGKRVRRVKEVVELVGMDPATRELLTHTVFKWNNQNDTFKYGGRSYWLEQIAQSRNWTPERLYEEMADRVRIIEWMIESDVKAMSEVTAVVQGYYRDRDAILRQVDGVQDV